VLNFVTRFYLYVKHRVLGLPHKIKSYYTLDDTNLSPTEEKWVNHMVQELVEVENNRILSEIMKRMK